MLLALVLALLLGRAEAAPSASYGSTGGWQLLPPGSGGDYGMNYQATIDVDGVYVGKTAYMRRRALNAAKLAGTVLTSAIASPVVGVALDALISAGLNYLDGKLVKPGPPVVSDRPGSFCYSWQAGYGSYCGTTITQVTGLIAAANDAQETGYTHYSCQLSGTASPYQVSCMTKKKSDGSVSGPWNYGRVSGTFSACPSGSTLNADGVSCSSPGSPIPVTGPTDAAALSAMQTQVTGMTPTAAHNLAEWARSQGIDLGTFTDYNGNVIAGPFDFPLPAKTSSSIDPTTGLRYDTNVVQSVHVAPNTDMSTSEQDPLVLTQNETKTEKTTNPDGSSTTKTTTTTTSGAANQQQQQDTGTPFQGPSGSVYTAKTKTFADVFGRFVNTIKASPWYVASAGFFSVTISGGACPHWSIAASKWLPALDAGQFVCSDTMTNLYRMGGVIVLIVAAWAAFRIAFL
ncbi:hypothetical protein [Cupriavidus sp. USMAHM13]|uniref:hypothetical protein n=1 Tax=Cupriavidus sp. USMAHM13 TaxID=1389192 RepID=UPI000A40EBED|nr:hypothetical protein [Cupriavidus sp. USMAHM13]